MTPQTSRGHAPDADPVPFRPGSLPMAIAIEDRTCPGAIPDAEPSSSSLRGPILFDPMLTLMADSLDDIERVRIAAENRMLMLTGTGSDADGIIRGLGLDIRSPEVARSALLLHDLRKLESDAARVLRSHMRASPFAPWIARSRGVGEKQAARLLASIGDPYWNTLHDRPRTVSELWSYAGYSVEDGRAPARRKGQRISWSATAKTRTYLVAVSCMKAVGGHYRGVYEISREQHSDRLHQAECHRCGPPGTAAAAGTPLAPGHQHARALRAVGKEVLRDLWIEARRLHQDEASRKEPD